MSTCEPVFFILFFGGTTVLITILMIIFILLMLGISYYLFKHRKQSFMVFHPESNPNLQHLLITTSYSLLIISIFAIVATATQSTILISIALLLGVVAVIAFELMLLTYFPKK